MVGALRAACDEMGVVLVRSAHSANVKERRDASTGLFDTEGQMVMQAENIPVHLGAMPAAAAAVLDEDHAPGDAWILNDPYEGGTHLPDITVISPVFAGGELAGFSASRAHHADVGGRVPGSMPADSKTLDEEGVVISPCRLAREGKLDRELLRELTSQMRGPRQREADLRAQLAANRTGAYRPVHVKAPEGSLLNARPPAAVVGGNVETSSRVADLVLQAFGRALGQGTMNNLTLGNDSFTYYETLGGGQGACEDADGPTAVHVAMSNTLNTPIEALEREFPLRAVEYAVRRGSGGDGMHRGGDGVVREIEALEEMTFSLITERRRHAPRGAAGGDDGERGRNLLNGEELPAKTTGSLRPGDRLRIETPGGGGHG